MPDTYLLSFFTRGPPFDKGYDLTDISAKVKQKLSPYFKDIFMYDKVALKELPGSESICNEFDEPLDQNPNANSIGYFDFKPFLIKHTLEQIPEGSILIYHDCNFIRNPQYWETDWHNIHANSERLLLENESDVFVQFERDAPIHKFVKTFTIDTLFPDPIQNTIVKNSFLLNAARIIMRNTSFTREFNNNYLELCLDKRLIAKSPNPNPPSDFEWSCGDQDVLNCLVYRYIFDGKFKPQYPIYSFLYRVLRFDNLPFHFPNQSWNPHPSGAQRLINNELIEYMKPTNMSKLDFNTPTDLCVIMGTLGSDKGSANIGESWHNYTVLYNDLFKSRRYDKLNVFELGISTGASLRAWADYFPNSEIYGGDCDVKTFISDKRIKSFYCDQTKSDSIRNLWNSIPVDFDVIIEDGMHELFANKIFFENSIHKLKVGGYFIIEDIRNLELNSAIELANHWKKVYPSLSVDAISVLSTNNNIDNNLIVVKRNV